MKTRQLIKKTMAWIGIAAILISGIACSEQPSKVDISEKLNTERLEDAAAVTLTSASDPQFVSEDVVSPVGQADPADKTKPADAEAIVPDSPLYDKLGAPKHYSVELHPTSDVVKITVDADVYLPDTDRMPTLHVTPGDFTQDEVTRLFRALCGDTVMYKVREQMTCSEIAARIADVQDELKTATDKDRINKLESNLAYWNEAYGNAPETIEDQVCEGILEERQLGIQEYLGKYLTMDAYQDPNDYWKGKHFSVHGNTYDKNLKSGYDFPVGANIHYSRDLSYGQHLSYNVKKWIANEDVVPAGAVGLTITPADARRIVETFWAENGFTDMAVSGVYLVRNNNTFSDPSERADAMGDAHAYVVTCGKLINGILLPAAEQGDPHWGFENCCFTITDNGIEGFTWYSPYAYGELTTDNSALLPFSTIDEIFRKMMLVRYDESDAGSTLTSATYHIDRVVLEMSRVTNRKTSEKGLLVPVWNFYGSYHFTYSDGHNHGSDDRQGFPNSLLRINAIDGSIIEPRYGC